MMGYPKFLTALKNSVKGFRLPRNLEEWKKLPIDQTIDRLRQLASTKAYGTYLRLAGATFAAYFLADTVSLFTESFIPEPPVVLPPRVTRKDTNRKSIEEFNAIISRNVFSAQGIIPDDESLASGRARKSALPFNLIGTVVLKDELKSIATIEDKSQSLVFPVRVDDVIDNRVKITKIEHLKVYFINQSNGHLEYIEIIDDVPKFSPQLQYAASRKGASGVSQNDETHYDIDRNVLDKSLGNLSEVLQQARAVPNFENGLPDGFKLLQIVPGSVFDQIGLKNMDVLCGINGESLNDAGKAFQLFNDLKFSNHVEVCVKRNGRKMNLSYDIH